MVLWSTMLMVTVRCHYIELAVFSREGGTLLYLLLHRSRQDDQYAGLWQFITGSIREGESAVEAALRELEEETGLKARALWNIPQTFSFYDPASDTMNVSPFFAAEVEAGSQVRLSPEHDEARWFPLEDAIPRLPWPSWREGLRGVQELIMEGGEGARHSRLG